MHLSEQYVSFLLTKTAYDLLDDLVNRLACLNGKRIFRLF